ncbi:hypothetical protein [Haemophilus haemolyticus]|uniref:hypothetical protein n=1 Tax=Haemophilus haemolyticus TaxID=726 RepID=UPI00080299C8|nr:hypothetical protein [Haemophilus haemolyticus]OBX88681.1 hypothetical protein A9499_02250 [Haemophilus haemolyticus]
MNKHWEQLIFCIVLHILFPLIPILVEFFRQEYITEATLVITTSIYCFSLGASSKNLATFAIYLLIGVIFMSMPVTYNKQPEITNYQITSILTLIIVSLWHLLERYNRHIKYKEIYWLLSSGDK